MNIPVGNGKAIVENYFAISEIENTSIFTIMIDIWGRPLSESKKTTTDRTASGSQVGVEDVKKNNRR